MAFYRLIEDDEVQVALWQIDETEEQLINISGLDLSTLYSYPRRRMERMAIKALLNHLNHLEPVQYHHNGRPYFKKETPNISISHAGKYVAVALCEKRHVGVDIENVNRNFKSIAKKYLTENELRWIDLKNQQSLALAWCIKESVYKLPWFNFKCYTTDIDIVQFGDIHKNGEVKVNVIDQKSIYPLVLKYLFFDDFCLSWVSN
jgi:phosphopantetheinyl transferase (holo-ACP synthase)